jgi:hypothetical protein
MDSFPALAPTARTFTVGDVPRHLQSGLSGFTVGYRTGNRRVQQSLGLTFGYLTEADMNLIKTHYFNAQGSYEIFFLSAELWGDYATPPIPLLSDYAWRYLSSPVVTDAGFDRFSVEVELQTIPIDPGDLVFDGVAASATPDRSYTLDGGSAAASPARDYIISPAGAL